MREIEGGRKETGIYGTETETETERVKVTVRYGTDRQRQMNGWAERGRDRNERELVIQN